MYKNHVLKASAKTLEDGSVTLGNRGHEHLPNHQISIEVSAQPTGGTLKIEYRSPGSTGYVEIEGSPIDLTALNTAAAYRADNLYVDSWKLTPTSLDAAKTYTVIITSNE
jgi:hypothetical protein